MPALSEIGKFKMLAELFVLAMKADNIISANKNNEAITCLTDWGLSERQAEEFIDAAFLKLDRGMLRSMEIIIKDVSLYFRRYDHGFILSQLQSILETGTITEQCQLFFDLCCDYLYHE